MKLEGRQCNNCQSVIFVGHEENIISRMTLCPVCGCQELKLIGQRIFITIPQSGEEEKHG